jgi:hypothetical protein
MNMDDDKKDPTPDDSAAETKAETTPAPGRRTVAVDGARYNDVPRLRRCSSSYRVLRALL